MIAIGKRATARLGAISLAFSVLCSFARADDTRTIALKNIHNGEVIEIAFRRNGEYVPEALERLNWFLRDWRRDEPTKIDPKLFDLLWSIHRELASKEVIHVVSGYRSPATNAMLRKTRGGQARKSQHMVGRAMDVHFPDVSVRKLRYSAMVREVGGVGYYPTSSIPFVHVDTGRVRHWPRMKRSELALLFPKGKSHHVPSDRKPLERGDFAVAAAQDPKLATVVASFHQLRAGEATSPIPAHEPVIPDWSSHTQVAAAVPRPAERPQGLILAGLGVPTLGRSASRLEAAPRPRLASLRPTPSTLRHDTTTGPTPIEQKMLSRLAALANERQPNEPETSDLAAPTPRPATPQIDKLAAIAAAEFDDEHPDELSYRPFPIAPYLTTTPSSDDKALVRMMHPDAASTLEFVDTAHSLPTGQFVFGPSIVVVATRHRFTGPSVRPSNLVRPLDLSPDAEGTALLASNR